MAIGYHLLPEDFVWKGILIISIFVAPISSTKLTKAGLSAMNSAALGV